MCYGKERKRLFHDRIIIEEKNLDYYIPSTYLSIGNAYGNRLKNHSNILQLKFERLFLGILTVSVPSRPSAP